MQYLEKKYVLHEMIVEPNQNLEHNNIFFLLVLRFHTKVSQLKVLFHLSLAMLHKYFLEYYKDWIHLLL